MSVRSLPPDEVRQHPDTKHITPGPTKSLLLRYRLKYAEKGTRTSPADTKRKKPTLEGWQQLATTDPRRIHAEHNNRRLRFDGILTPTGAEFERIVLDVDSLRDLDRLQKKLDVRLREISTEVETPSGGRHIHFILPKGMKVSGSVGKKVQDGFEGLDVRGEGNLVLLPPSAGYRFANDLPIAPAPRELVEWAGGRTRSRVRDASEATRRIEIPDGELVEEGNRNTTIFWEAYDRHQAGESLEDIEAWALAFNEKRCDPGRTHAHTDAEALRTVRSACGYPIRHREQDPRAREVLEKAWRAFYAEVLPKSGRSKKRDSFRSLLEFGGRHGGFIEVILEGEVRRAVAVSLSSRQGAIPAATSNVTFWKQLIHLESEGKVLAHSRLSGKELGDEEPETWLILEPVTKVNTPGMSPLQEEDAGGVNPCRGPANTPTFRYRHPVGNSRGGTLVAVEMYGPGTAEELAEIMGYSRVSDFRRKHLDVLVERGDLIEVDGLYGTPEKYWERMVEERHTLYSGSKRRRTSVDPSGMEIHWVEYGPEKSDVERDADALERYAKERRNRRKAKRRAYQDPANSPEEMLPVPKNLGPEADGEISELKRIEPEAPAPAGPTRVPAADDPLVVALRGFFDRNPHRAGETPSWLSVALWAEEFLASRPRPAEVEAALVELMIEAA